MPHFRNLKIWMCLVKIYNLEHKTQIPSALLLRKASPKGMGMRTRAAAVMTGKEQAGLGGGGRMRGRVLTGVSYISFIVIFATKQGTAHISVPHWSVGQS